MERDMPLQAYPNAGLMRHPPKKVQAPVFCIIFHIRLQKLNVQEMLQRSLKCSVYLRVSVIPKLCFESLIDFGPNESAKGL